MSSPTAYIGIDPGSKGFIAIDAPSGRQFHALADYDLPALADLFYSIASQFPSRICAIEDVRAIHGSSSVATFNFGLGKGVLLALLAATRTPYELVLPQRWQKRIWSPSDVQKGPDGRTDTKRTSMSAARRLAPDTDFRRSEKCRNIDDNKCDAFLLSQYAKRFL